MLLTVWQSPRKLILTCGTITVQRSHVRNLAEHFISRLLPLFQRRTKQVGELLLQLYLHGLALGDFELALRGLLGEGAPVSSVSLQRLKAQWQDEYATWKQQRLDTLEVVYVWADGLYVKAGIEHSKAALLVLIGVSAVMQCSPAVVIEFFPPSDGGGRRWSLTRRERQPSCPPGRSYGGGLHGGSGAMGGDSAVAT